MGVIANLSACGPLPSRTPSPAGDRRCDGRLRIRQKHGLALLAAALGCQFQEGDESWSRSFEQDSAKAKWTAARVGPLQFRARGVTEGGRSPTGDTSCARRKIHAAATRGDGVK